MASGVRTVCCADFALRRCVVRSPNSMAKRGDHFMSWRLELKPAGLVAVVGVLCGNDLDR